MSILAIDPGTTESAFVSVQANGTVLHRGIRPNDEILLVMRATGADSCAIEMVASYGMPVGAEVFETVRWIGRFEQAWRFARKSEPTLVYRRDVKMFLCGVPNAKDANIRQALIDRYGGSKESAIGKKATPGPLYGFKSHMWAALGVAVTQLNRECPQIYGPTSVVGRWSREVL